MLHPSNLAQNYIFDSFCIAYLTPKAQEFGKESSRLVAALNHRPIQPETEGYRQFINNTIMKIKALQAKYPLIDANILLKEVK